MAVCKKLTIGKSALGYEARALVRFDLLSVSGSGVAKSKNLRDRYVWPWSLQRISATRCGVAIDEARRESLMYND